MVRLFEPVHRVYSFLKRLLLYKVNRLMTRCALLTLQTLTLLMAMLWPSLGWAQDAPPKASKTPKAVLHPNSKPVSKPDSKPGTKAESRKPGKAAEDEDEPEIVEGKVLGENEPKDTGPTPEQLAAERAAKRKTWLEHLKNRDQRVRLAAVKSLGEMGAEAEIAVPSLVDIVRNNYDPCRKAAIVAVGQIGPKAYDATNPLIQALKSSDVEEAAGKSLAQIGPQAVPILRAGLKNKHPRVRVWCAYALGEIGPPSAPAIPQLVECLYDEHSGKRAAVALGKIGKAAVQPLLGALEGRRYPRPREHVLKAFGIMGSQAREALPNIIPLFESYRLYEVQERAAKALSLIAPEDLAIIDLFIKTLAKPKLAQLSAQTLGEMGDKAVCRLAEGLVSEDRSVRRNAVVALGIIGPKAGAAVSPLNEALKREDNRLLISLLITTLGKIGPKAAPTVETLLGFLKNTSFKDRSYVADTLGRIGPAAKAAGPALMQSLRSKDRWLQRSSARALGQIGASRAARRLVRCLWTGDKFLRRIVVVALRRLSAGLSERDQPEVIMALTRTLRDRDRLVRVRSAKALGDFGQEARLAVLALKAAHKYDEERAVRKAAKASLEKITKIVD